MNGGKTNKQTRKQKDSPQTQETQADSIMEHSIQHANQPTRQQFKHLTIYPTSKWQCFELFTYTTEDSNGAVQKYLRITSLMYFNKQAKYSINYSIYLIK